MNIRKNLISPSKMVRRIHLSLLMAAMLAMVVLLPGVGQAVTISSGWDFFTTDSASVDLSGLGLGWVNLQGLPYPPDNCLFPIPKPPSPCPEPTFTVTWLNQHGAEVDYKSIHKVTQIITPNPCAGPFDTIVLRKEDVNIDGAGDTATTPIEIIWLSLKSKNPINYPGVGLLDLYVGLTPGVNQIEGKMKLTSNQACGNSGTVDIGLRGLQRTTPATRISWDCR